MTYKYGNWYCAPSNEEEAREIIERAISSGAEKDETFSDWSWDAYEAWGVYNGRTFTQKLNFYRNYDFTEYTIEQVREKFRLPSEQVNSKWNGEGSPPIGAVCEIYMGPYHSDRRETGEVVKVLATAENSSGKTMVLIEICGEDGECDALNVQCLRPLHNEREEWVKSAHKIANDDSGSATFRAIGIIYDAIKSGDLKAPEVEI